MRKALTILFIMVVSSAWGQQNSSSMSFFAGLTDCAASLGGWKCLELDLSSEVAVENDSSKAYEYSWNFGDGNRKAGPKVEHCYNEFGSYQVTMDLIDTETNTVIRNELSSTLHLFPEIYPAIITKTENLPPSFMEFNCKYNDADKFQPDRVYWRIDGAYYEGNTISHSFPVAGVYLVEMGVEKNMDFLGTVTACTSTEITIKESDVWSAEMSNFVGKEREKARAGPFASSDVMCFIKTNSGDQTEVSLTPLNMLMTQVILKGGHDYEVMLFSGNLFTVKKHFNTNGITGSNLYRVLKDTVSSFLNHELSFIPPVRFEKNQTAQPVDESQIRQTADLLRQHPYLQIEVGSYLHTGGRISKAMQISLDRAAAVRDALIKYGVATGKISIASPSNHHALMNTCSAVLDCEWENSELNGKVEFKITGINL